MGFCLYPILGNGGGGSGLGFSTVATRINADEHVYQHERNIPTVCHSFNSLEAIKIKVTYLQGMDPKVRASCDFGSYHE